MRHAHKARARAGAGDGGRADGEVDPLHYAGQPNLKHVHILLLAPRQKLHSAPNHPKIVFRLVIGPDLLKERGIKQPNLGK